MQGYHECVYVWGVRGITSFYITKLCKTEKTKTSHSQILKNNQNRQFFQKTFVIFFAVVTKLRLMKLGNCFSKFVNQSSSFPELFLDLTTTEPEPELFSFGLFWGAGARAGKARQVRLELEHL